MTNILIILLTAAWLFLSWVNAGFLLAYLQGRFPGIAAEDYRLDVAVSIGISLLPWMWLFTPFLSGFYAYGWMKLWARKNHSAHTSTA